MEVMGVMAGQLPLRPQPRAIREEEAATAESSASPEVAASTAQQGVRHSKTLSLEIVAQQGEEAATAATAVPMEILYSGDGRLAVEAATQAFLCLSLQQVYAASLKLHRNLSTAQSLTISHREAEVVMAEVPAVTSGTGGEADSVAYAKLQPCWQ
ncbi:hypothetical protein ES703_31152 [subsurface metagenome]